MNHLLDISTSHWERKLNMHFKFQNTNTLRVNLKQWRIKNEGEELTCGEVSLNIHQEKFLLRWINPNNKFQKCVNKTFPLQLLSSLTLPKSQNEDIIPHANLIFQVEVQLLTLPCITILRDKEVVGKFLILECGVLSKYWVSKDDDKWGIEVGELVRWKLFLIDLSSKFLLFPSFSLSHSPLSLALSSLCFSQMRW